MTPSLGTERGPPALVGMRTVLSRLRHRYSPAIGGRAYNKMKNYPENTLPLNNATPESQNDSAESMSELFQQVGKGRHTQSRRTRRMKTLSRLLMQQVSDEEIIVVWIA